MEIKSPKNSNYAAIVVKINKTIELKGCDNIHAAIILGNHVIVSKDIKEGDFGVYFPPECQLSKEFAKYNNLYRKSEFNADSSKKGYLEETRRVKCIRLRGYKSEGTFMPLSCLYMVKDVNFTVGQEFDELNGVEICKKYVVKTIKTPGSGNKNSNKKSNKPVESKIIDNQFRFHLDTSMFYKNIHKFTPETLISITTKLHGTSGISSYVLCKKKLKWYERFLSKFVDVVNTKYDYIYSSRKVIKNPELNPNPQHYYKEDIWGIAHNELKDSLQEGYTFYYEIVGFTPNGTAIQKDYDYGCKSYSQGGAFAGQCEHKIYIYRITYTTPNGKVIEFSAKQVQDYCTKYGLTAVPEVFYGFAHDFLPVNDLTETEWQNAFLEKLKLYFNDHDCKLCYNKVPEEGVVIRIEDGLDCEAYKLKSFLFYERETKALDKGESNMEDEN